MEKTQKSGWAKAKERKEKAAQLEALRRKNLIGKFLLNPNKVSSDESLSGSLQGPEQAKNNDAMSVDDSVDAVDDDMHTMITNAISAVPMLHAFDPKNPYEWPETLSDVQRQFVVQHGLYNETKLRDIFGSLNKDCADRHFSTFLLYSSSLNGREQTLRDWLTSNKKTSLVHCLPCCLFSLSKNPKNNVSYLTTREGFNPSISTWKSLYHKLPQHENSPAHKQNYLDWRKLEYSINGGEGALDNQFQRHLQEEKISFENLLRRILDVTLFLSERGLAFRGDNEKIGDPHNGNFLGLLELISRYDSLTREHLSKVRQSQEDKKRLQAHALSYHVQNEFIGLCGDHVLEVILKERRDSIYYSIICDSTPDVSHIEQNVIILRYVYRDKTTNVWSVEERFLEFFNLHQKKGENICGELLSRLEHHEIDILDCRGQSYDNASNMSGKIKGVQARILEINPNALYSPCGAHSLNLVGEHAAACCMDAKTFFGNVSKLYNLFSCSPERWEMLQQKLNCSLHSMSETRWSARKEAVMPIANHLPSVIELLNDILSEHKNKLTSEKFVEVQGLKKYFSSFIGVLMSAIWIKILFSIDQRNLILQSKAITLEVAISNMKDLTQEIENLRNNWDAILLEAKLVAGSLDIEPEFSSTRTNPDPEI
jgi:hypothetical protein